MIAVSLGAVILFTSQLTANEPLLQASFENGAANWTKHDQAFLSDIARRPGAKSLLIKQWKDEEQAQTIWRKTGP